MVSDLVKTVCQNFPSDRKVLTTSNPERFWKIVNQVLNVPPENVLRGNFMFLDKFIEAVNSFAYSDLDSPNYDWTNLETEDVEPSRANDALKDLMQYKILAVDIETRRIEYDDNRVLLIGFAYSTTQSKTFDVAQFTGAEWATLQALFACKDISFVWHNGKFDTARLKYLVNIDARIDDDTMLEHYIGINEKKGTHGLKDLGPLYLQAPQWDDQLQEFKRTWCRQNGIKLADFLYDMIPSSILKPYLHRDCIATYRLNIVFKTLMRPESRWLYERIIEAANVYKDIELAGCYLDTNYMSELQDTLDDGIAKAEKELQTATRLYWDPLKYVKESGAKAYVSTFNLNSPKQLKWILETATKTKITSTDKEALEGLADEFPEEPFIQAIAKLRKLGKYMDTYVIGVQNVVCKDNRVRCTFNLHGTETGRLSCSEPNMQNIPREKTIKNIFRAAPGKRLLQFDYSQAELRVLAWLCQDEYLKDTYRNGGDLHDAMALRIFGEGFTKEDRVKAKTVNFGIPYGRGPGTISKDLHMTFQDARKLIQDWYKAAPGAKRFVDEMRAIPTKRNAEPYTTVFGRQRHFILTNENLNALQNESINFPIQGTASDCTVLSVCELHKALKEMGLLGTRATICNNVHDSILLEIDDDDALEKQIAKIGSEIMANVPKKYLPGLDFPFKADVESGYRWGELHKCAA